MVNRSRASAAAVLVAFALVTSHAAQQAQSREVDAVDFGELNGGEPYNASGVVALDGSRFLFVDNNSSAALYELALDADGAMRGPIVRRPLTGLAPDAVGDLESLTSAAIGRTRYLFAASSLNAKVDKTTGEVTRALEGLVRVRYAPSGTLRAEAMPGFRAWLVSRVPRLAEAAARVADEAGLNVEGLAWDPVRRALLVGVRSPLAGGKPFVVPVRVRNLGGPWRTDNLEVLPEIVLATEKTDQGIRDIQYDSGRHAFLVLVGRSVSGTATPFQLYVWDGAATGKVRLLRDLSFPEKMKPEGVAVGSVGGRRAIVFVDDRGGFAVLRDDDPRLK
jgi:hypothetical protein